MEFAASGDSGQIQRSYLWLRRSYAEPEAATKAVAVVCTSKFAVHKHHNLLRKEDKEETRLITQLCYIKASAMGTN